MPRHPNPRRHYRFVGYLRKKNAFGFVNIPVYWDTQSNRFVKVTPCPHRVMAADGRLIEDVPVWG